MGKFYICMSEIGNRIFIYDVFFCLASDHVYTRFSSLSTIFCVMFFCQSQKIVSLNNNFSREKHMNHFRLDSYKNRQIRSYQENREIRQEFN